MASTQSEPQPQSNDAELETAFHDLKRLIPSLAAEVDFLRTSLREHSLWLLRYGHTSQAPEDSASSAPGTLPAYPADPPTPPPPVALPFGEPTGGRSEASASASTRGLGGSRVEQGSGVSAAQAGSGPSTGDPPPSFAESSPTSGTIPPPPSSSSTAPAPGPGPDADHLPAYSASDVPPYTLSTREEVRARRDQLTEWLREGEDVLREYSARYAQLAEALRLPQEDLLGTWREADPDNALPDYQRQEMDEELMVGVGEVPPPYLG